MVIRPATSGDRDAIWAILAPMIAAGETYPLPRDMSKDAALAYWFSPTHGVFVLEHEGRVAGTYYMRPNQPGAGSHVANCGYVTAGWAQGQGLGRAMCHDSLARAKALGFRAMQFNFVVSTNQRAVRAWEACGFAIVGRLPGAFRHPSRGYVDALVMFQDFERASTPIR